MNNKYYTPKIEEFHVGFECEWQSRVRNETWNKQISDTDLVSIAYDAIEHSDEDEPFEEQFRVKYLDKTDIEDCGWEGQKANSVYFTKDNYRLVHWISDAERTISIYETYDGGTQEECIVRKDKIKNKTEFIKVLKQLGLWKN